MLIKAKYKICVMQLVRADKGCDIITPPLSLPILAGSRNGLFHLLILLDKRVLRFQSVFTETLKDRLGIVWQSDSLITALHKDFCFCVTVSLGRNFTIALHESTIPMFFITFGLKNRQDVYYLLLRHLRSQKVPHKIGCKLLLGYHKPFWAIRSPKTSSSQTHS